MRAGAKNKTRSQKDERNKMYTDFPVKTYFVSEPQRGRANIGFEKTFFL